MFDRYLDTKQFTDIETSSLVLGGAFYDLYTKEGKKAISLRAAREKTDDELFLILNYMNIADGIDTDENMIHKKSYENIIQALIEKMPPLTAEQEAAKERTRKVLEGVLNQK